jgi:putative multiple sugar transport system substrate-binding protein
MRRSAIGLVAIAAAGALALTGCSGSHGNSNPSDSESSSTESGFAADATIGVALPWLGTQNWKEAEEMFKQQLSDAGFKPLVQEADNKVPQQQQQIEAMIQKGAKVIVVAPVDSTQLGDVLAEADDAGVKVIGYDRLIENTEAVTTVVQSSSIRTGELQGQSLLDGLAARKGEGPYNIELFGGSPADLNAPNFFKGAMTVLQPKIDSGVLKIVSGQTDFNKCATADWDNSKAQTRMDSLLSGFYTDKRIDGVLTPNDGIARAVMTSSESAGQELPVVTGLDAENESVVSVWQGRQWSTIAKPTAPLVAKTVELIQAMQKGGKMPQATAAVDNGVAIVDLYELDPIVVTKDNEQQVFANDPTRLALLQ